MTHVLKLPVDVVEEDGPKDLKLTVCDWKWTVPKNGRSYEHKLESSYWTVKFNSSGPSMDPFTEVFLNRSSEHFFTTGTVELWSNGRLYLLKRPFNT